MQSPYSFDKSLNVDLLNFYDDFVELHDHCAFLCDAYASLAGADEPLEASTVMGLKPYGYWVKERMETLKRELQALRARF